MTMGLGTHPNYVCTFMGRIYDIMERIRKIRPLYNSNDNNKVNKNFIDRMHTHIYHIFCHKHAVHVARNTSSTSFCARFEFIFLVVQPQSIQCDLIVSSVYVVFEANIFIFPPNSD